MGEGSLEKDSPKNILVTGVIKNSPAHLANLLPGDIILEADNKPTKETKGGIVTKEGYIHLSNLKQLDESKTKTKTKGKK